MKFSIAFLGLVILSGCASAPPLQSSRLTVDSVVGPAYLELTQVPFVDQAEGHCGPASLKMMMEATAHPVDLEVLTKQVYAPKARGSFQTDMLSAVRRQGLVALPVKDMSGILNEVSAGHPVLVFQNLAFRWYPYWHYAVVTGYDLNKKNLIMHSGPEKSVHRDMKIFEQSWLLADRWAYVIMKPGMLSKTANESEYLKAALALEESGQTEAALKTYLSVYQRWPESLKASLASANLLYQIGQLPRAQQILLASVEKHPNSYQAWNNLSVVQEERGEKKAAEKSFLKARALQTQEIELDDKSPSSRQGS